MLKYYTGKKWRLSCGYFFIFFFKITYIWNSKPDAGGHTEQ